MKYIIKAIANRELYVLKVDKDGFVHLTDNEFEAKIFTEQGLDMETRVLIKSHLKSHYGYMASPIRIL